MMNRFAIIFLVLLTSSCASKDEVARQLSPAGNAEAILIETNGGATTSFGYEVYVRSTINSINKIKVATFYGAIRSESAYGINLNWVSNETIELQYLRAKSAQLLEPLIVLNDVKYKVVLRSGAVDASAPAGGMLYNLQIRPYG
jgi:hypothetical protein